MSELAKPRPIRPLSGSADGSSRPEPPPLPPKNALQAPRSLPVLLTVPNTGPESTPPKVTYPLFLDEPTGAVDPALRRYFWEQIAALSASGRTVMVTSHYMDEVDRCHDI